jgi:hypothetical protein
MYILEAPYVSTILARSAETAGRPVLATAVAEEALAASDVNLLDDAAFAAHFRQTPGARLYTNSENALDWVCRYLADTDLPAAIDRLKDKVAFRRLLADLDPATRFAEVHLSALDAFDPAAVGYPFVIKPAAGFFSLGVHRVEESSDWPRTKENLKVDAERYARVYPRRVLELDRLVAESVIEGDEFAVDAYFDAQGRPVVVGILEHPFASGADVSDRVYRTGAETIRRWREPFEDYLHELGRRAGLRNFPLHIELRVNGDGAIRPIEANPLRFGGWCAGDIGHYAWGFDPYHVFLEDHRPDWDRLLVERDEWTTALVAADLPPDVDRRHFEVDYEAFADRFTDLLELRPLRDPRQPVFAFAYLRVPADDPSELEEILHADLREYLRPRAS